MNEPIRQHLVPRCYLKNFALSRKKEWYIDACDVNVKPERIFNVNIKNVCVKTDFYTFKKLPDEQKRFLERYYSRTIESDYTEIYDTLINGKSISGNKRFKIISFIICQYLRTSKLTNSFNKGWTKMLTNGYNLMQYHNSPEKKIFFDGGGHIDFTDKSLNEVINNANDENREFINIENYNRFKTITMQRINDGIAVYELHPNEKLITSDNPVFCWENISDPSAIIRMPINSKYFVSLIPFEDEDLFDKKFIYRRKMDEEHSNIEAIVMNCAQIDQAEQFILGNKESLERSLNQCNSDNIADLQSRANELLSKAEKRLKDTKAAYGL